MNDILKKIRKMSSKKVIANYKNEKENENKIKPNNVKVENEFEKLCKLYLRHYDKNLNFKELNEKYKEDINKDYIRTNLKENLEYFYELRKNIYETFKSNYICPYYKKMTKQIQFYVKTDNDLPKLYDLYQINNLIENKKCRLVTYFNERIKNFKYEFLLGYYKRDESKIIFKYLKHIKYSSDRCLMSKFYDYDINKKNQLITEYKELCDKLNFINNSKTIYINCFLKDKTISNFIKNLTPNYFPNIFIVNNYMSSYLYKNKNIKNYNITENKINLNEKLFIDLDIKEKNKNKLLKNIDTRIFNETKSYLRKKLQETNIEELNFNLSKYSGVISNSDYQSDKNLEKMLKLPNRRKSSNLSKNMDEISLDKSFMEYNSNFFKYYNRRNYNVFKPVNKKDDIKDIEYLIMNLQISEHNSKKPKKTKLKLASKPKRVSFKENKLFINENPNLNNVRLISDSVQNKRNSININYDKDNKKEYLETEYNKNKSPILIKTYKKTKTILLKKNDDIIKLNEFNLNPIETRYKKFISNKVLLTDKLNLEKITKESEEQIFSKLLKTKFSFKLKEQYLNKKKSLSLKHKYDFVKGKNSLIAFTNTFRTKQKFPKLQPNNYISESIKNHKDFLKKLIH